MKKLLADTVPALYEHVTGHVAEQISHFMTDSHRHTGTESVAMRERAYGLYTGWRALAVEMTSPQRFYDDDRSMEQLIAESPAVGES